jgi:murein DD-endopeptidase MepM/ murein hydrolase activator NlpD
MRIRVPIQIASVLVFGALLGMTGSVVFAAAAGDKWKVAWEPAQLVNGSSVLFRVTGPANLQSLSGTWLDHELAFRFDQACACWYAIAGIDLNSKPGRLPLRLEGNGKEGAATDFVSDVPVGVKRYPTTAISVAPQYVQPPPEVLARIQEDQALKKQIFSHMTPESAWSGRFKAPVESVVTAVFGSARTYNGVKKSQHEGMDFRAATGTTVRASNRGTVILARNLYYEGNCVMVDHGQGLLTIQMHLSEIRVKEGETVEAGQVLGLSGSTGRVTAPHLHFAVRWQGIYVDPATLLALHPPER